MKIEVRRIATDGRTDGRPVGTQRVVGCACRRLFVCNGWRSVTDGISTDRPTERAHVT